MRKGCACKSNSSIGKVFGCMSSRKSELEQHFQPIFSLLTSGTSPSHRKASHRIRVIGVSWIFSYAFAACAFTSRSQTLRLCGRIHHPRSSWMCDSISRQCEQLIMKRLMTRPQPCHFLRPQKAIKKASVLTKHRLKLRSYQPSVGFALRYLNYPTPL